MNTKQLGYCSNIHPGESLEDVYKNISKYIVKVRKRLNKKTISSGLWLSSKVSEQLQNKKELDRFKTILLESKIELRTLNGFPFGGFHEEVVKQNVYLPDWSDNKRLEYTIRLAKVLSYCLPKDENIGTISTLPLGYKSTWSSLKTNQALALIDQLSIFLNNLKKESSKKILICFEPEPDCAIESTKELIEFFKLIKKNITYPSYFGVCFDVCHQAVMGENMFDCLNKIIKNDILIGKIQLSNALGFDPSKTDKKNLLDSMNSFLDKRYLHQVKSIDSNNNLNSWKDLELAKDQLLLYNNSFRVHFHIPLDLETLVNPWLFTTSKELKEVLNFLKNNLSLNPHLEVETYSWEVLPKSLRPTNDEELIDGIVKELLWVENNLKDSV